MVVLLVKVMNRLRKQEAPVEAPVATPEDSELLREIRDELKRRPQV